MRAHAPTARSLALVADANHAGKHDPWEFNEWLHGQSGRPMGHPQQAWSAAMFVDAHDALERGTPAFFGTWGV